MRFGNSAAASVFMVLMLLIAVPTGAAGQTTVPQCSELDEFVWVITIGVLNSEKCDSSYLSDLLQQQVANDQAATEAELYDRASEIAQSNDQFGTVMNNGLQDSRTAVWAKGEAEAFSAIDQGLTRQLVKDQVNATVEDYYATKQINLANRWIDTRNQIDHLQNLSELNGFSYTSRMQVAYDDGSGGYTLSGPYGSKYHPKNSTTGTHVATFTLVNGSTVQVPSLELSSEVSGAVSDPDGGTGYNIDGGDGDSSSSDRFVDPLADPSASMYWRDGGQNRNAQFDLDYVYVKPVGTNPGFTIDLLTIKETNVEIESQSAQMKANLAPYVDTLYNETQAGNISAAEHINPLTLAQEYSTDYNTTGYHSYAIATLAGLGYTSPQLNGTDYMTIAYGGQQYNGLLFSQEAPSSTNGTWVANQAYSTLAIPGSQVIATTDGRLIEMDGSFTIVAMKDKNGNDIQETGTQQYYYNTTNVSEYEALQQSIRELRTEIESRQLQPAGGGGAIGGSFWDQLSKTEMLVGGAVIGGLLVLLARD